MYLCDALEILPFHTTHILFVFWKEHEGRRERTFSSHFPRQKEKENIWIELKREESDGKAMRNKKDSLFSLYNVSFF